MSFDPSTILEALATGLIERIGSRLLPTGDARHHALHRCIRSGVAALVADCWPGDRQELEHLRDLFLAFFQNEEVARELESELTLLLKGTTSATGTLSRLFERAGYDPTTLGFDLERAWSSFEQSFRAAAMQQPELRPEMLVAQTAHQTQHLKAILDRLDRLSEALAAPRGQEPTTMPDREALDNARSEVRSAIQWETNRRHYLQRAIARWQILPLDALGGRDHDHATLNQVYVELETTSPIPIREDEGDIRVDEHESMGAEQDLRRETALEAASGCERLVLLGDPGAGKSTFAKSLLADLGTALLVGEDPPAGFPRDLLPVLLHLRDLVPFLAKLDLERLGDEDRSCVLAGAFVDSVVNRLRRTGSGEFVEGFRRTIERGHCVVVLDGMDEVPEPARRDVREVAFALIREFHVQRLIVTCRLRAYHGDAVLGGFEVRELAPFGERQICRFAEKWYEAQAANGRVDPASCEARIQDLAQSALSTEFRPLARRPMLLTTLALVHLRDFQLPKERVRLYQEAVAVLLTRWQRYRGAEPERSRRLKEVLGNNLLIYRIVERLGYEAHAAEQRIVGGDQTAGALERMETLRLLESEEYLGEIGLANEFLDYVDLHAGLLVGRGGGPTRPERYAFPHRTFQEYLAGCHLVGQGDRNRRYFELAGYGDSWTLATQLGAEELLHVRRMPDAVFDLAMSLGGGELETEIPQWHRAWLWSGSIAALLGQRWLSRDERTRDYLQKIRPRLTRVLQGRFLPPERADAGRALARLEAPLAFREDVAICCVPAGEFVSRHAVRFADPRMEERNIDYPYWILRTPVTNAQFGTFVDAGGYKEGSFWTEADALGVWRNGRIDDQPGAPREAPRAYGDPFDLLNHPVVGVTFYEALAYSRWVAKLLTEEGILPPEWIVTLPSELEWEKAARGGHRVPKDALTCTLSSWPSVSKEIDAHDMQPHEDAGGAYPWGTRATSDVANLRDSGIGTTSATGCFPMGSSPYGCEDMFGNVFEWTCTFWGVDHRRTEDWRSSRDADAGLIVPRVLRGGSFETNLAFGENDRQGFSPMLRRRDVGIRLVVVPASCRRALEPIQ